MRRNTQHAGLLLLTFTLTAFLAVTDAAVAAARPWLGVYTQAITSDLRDGARRRWPELVDGLAARLILEAHLASRRFQARGR